MESTALPVSVMVEEQQERLRRFVDEWREQLNCKLESFRGEALEFCFNDLGDINSEPLHISMEPKESVTITSLLDTGNVPFNKILMVLAYDCFQVGCLQRQALKRFYPQLLTFSLSSGPEEVLLEGEPQKKFARSFTFFYELSGFLLRLRAVLSNLVQQMEAIYSGDARNKGCNSFAHVHLRKVVLCLADGFGILLTLDEILGKISAIGHALSLFIRMLHVVRGDILKFETKAEHVESLDQVVKDINDTLQPGIFQRCLHEDFIERRSTIDLKLSSQCLGEIALCVHDGLLQLLMRIDTLKERPDDQMQLAGLLAVFILHSWNNVGGPEKKVEKLIVEILRRVPVLHVYSCIRLIPLDLLMSHLPPLALSWPFLKEMRKEAGTNKTNLLAGLDDAMAREIQGLQSAITRWTTFFGSTVSPMAQQSALHIRRQQILEGIYTTNRLRHILTATIDLHVTLEVPIKKEKLMNMCHATIFLKVVENMFHRTSSEIALSITHIIHHIQIQLRKRLLPLKVQLEADLQGKSKMKGFSLLSFYLTRGRDLDTKMLDALASVDLALKMLEDSASEKRRAILSIALNFVESMQIGTHDDWRKISSLMLELELVAEINSYVEAATDCSFLYWRSELFSTWFATIYAQSDKALKLQFVVNALLDGVKLLKRGNAEQSLVIAYEQEIEKHFTNEIIKPLCKDIETDLRLHVHSAHMKGAVTTNPIKTGIRDLSWFLHIKPIKLALKSIFIKSRVETYLNSAFYNHVAMSLNNWKTYCEMRHLAEQKYGLELDDIHLPGHLLEQGVDVLKIMRNINSFVSCYCYDLNAEVFIEKISNAHGCKHLATVGVKHVANSIRTHGTGIISTTVNYIYQLLAQKFVVFSQFLFDDHIKSLLVKEFQFWKEYKNQNMGYPVIRAEKLNKNVRKLGLSDDNLSFLDQFRLLICEIGNALGFVRMVRTGEMRYSTTASGFVQNTKMHHSFEEASQRMNLSEETVMAEKLLDTFVKNLDTDSQQKNYFNILTTVFAKELQSSDNIHLREFYLILPALTTNAMDSMLQSKDKRFKRGHDATNAVFTDDGLILGIVYALKVLDQDKHFDSLHWFDSAKRHYTTEKARIENEINMDNFESGMNGLAVWSQKLASISEEEVQNLQLMAKRLSSFITELEIMEYKLSSSRVLFL